FLAERCRLFAPFAAHQVIGASVQEVHRDEGEKLRRAALEKQHIMRIAEPKQFLAKDDRLVVDGLELLAAIAYLGDDKPLALLIQQRLRRFLERLGREHRRTGAEIEDAMRHFCVTS